MEKKKHHKSKRRSGWKKGRMMPTDDQKEEILNIYVNGILSPKDEIEWSEMNEILTGFFGGTSHHIHNPFLAIENPHQVVMKAAVENPKLAAAVGFGVLGLGAMAYMTGTSNKQLMLQCLFIALESVLKEESLKVAPNVVERIAELLDEVHQAREKEADKKFDFLTLNIFAHSHGGMVLDSVIASPEFTQLLEASGYPFRLEVKIHIAGCPILDVISLMFHDSPLKLAGASNLPDHVTSTKLPGFHASKIYAENLSRCS